MSRKQQYNHVRVTLTPTPPSPKTWTTPTYHLERFTIRRNVKTVNVQLHGLRGNENRTESISFPLLPNVTDADLVRAAVFCSSHKWTVHFGMNVKQFNGKFAQPLDQQLLSALMGRPQPAPQNFYPQTQPPPHAAPTVANIPISQPYYQPPIPQPEQFQQIARTNNVPPSSDNNRRNIWQWYKTRTPGMKVSLGCRSLIAVLLLFSCIGSAVGSTNLASTPTPTPTSAQEAVIISPAPTDVPSATPTDVPSATPVPTQSNPKPSISPPVTDVSPYGVTTIHADNQLLSDFHDLNIHWLRYQVIGYSINWSTLDADIARLNAAGIHIDFSIHCIVGNDCWNNPPLPTPAQMASFAQQIATRYNGQPGSKGFIDAFEIGNEEFDFYQPNQYPPILQAGCRAVKAASPKALCGMYGTHLPNISHYTAVLTEIFNQGVGSSMDFMNFHYYVQGHDPAVGPPSFDQLWQAYHSIASSHGFSQLPIWVTETGWITAPLPWNPTPLSPTTQTQYLQYMFDHARNSAHAVQRIFWFTLDYGDQGDSLDRTSTGRLPAFFTYQQYVKQYPTW
jgi:Glycosyl hydrolase catalytic core